MKIGFLSVGTEILLGDTVNTNLTNLGKRLYDAGFKLNKEITISDNEKEIHDAITYLLESCDVVVTSGGLGPTEDDITKEVISNSLSLDLELDESHVEWMKERWKSRGLIMPKTNIKQAYIPVGSEKLINTQGTAPGIRISKNDKKIFIFPGPPREFIPLVEDELLPYLSENFEKNDTDYKFIMFFNQAESSLAAEIDKFKPQGLDIAYLASRGIIKLRFDRNSVSKNEFDKFINKIDEIFSDDILAYENISVEKALGSLLAQNEIKVSFVESITGGLLSSLLVKNPGISKYFIGSDVVYGNQAKSILLNDSDIDFENWEELCLNLTHSSLEKYKTDICLTILGEAGPLSSSKYAVGTIFICISNGDKTVITDHKLNGNREEILQRSANKAQWELIKFIKNLY
ncbi:molybdopterin-binding protein [Acidimicrobiaceae bacterium]|nr:molybdopterin-binding protein [Acidimicrobiaceae bacterium]